MSVGEKLCQGNWIGDPSEQLLACDEEDIRELQERVDEPEEGRLSVFPGPEPGGVVSHGEGGLGAVSVMSGWK